MGEAQHQMQGTLSIKQTDSMQSDKHSNKYAD